MQGFVQIFAKNVSLCIHNDVWLSKNLGVHLKFVFKRVYHFVVLTWFIFKDFIKLILSSLFKGVQSIINRIRAMKLFGWVLICIRATCNVKLQWILKGLDRPWRWLSEILINPLFPVSHSIIFHSQDLLSGFAKAITKLTTLIIYFLYLGLWCKYVRLVICWWVCHSILRVEWSWGLTTSIWT